MRRPGPSTDEVMALAFNLWRSGDRHAKKAMQPFINTRNADLALPHVRRQARRILEDRSVLVSRALRDEIKEFGALYGLQTRGYAPMAYRLNLRLSGEQMDDLKDALKLLSRSEDDLTAFIRNAALTEARRVIDANDSNGE